MKLRINSTHSYAERGADFYPTPPEAIAPLIALEEFSIPAVLWEPACGDGAIVRPLRAAGYVVVATDLHPYGLERSVSGMDYLTMPKPDGVGGIITNPPYRLAAEFAAKAVSEVGYVAFLLRLNFLESTGRLPFFEAHPPSRVWVSSRRLPMMHRQGWEGPKASSNQCYGWFIWNERRRSVHPEIRWFDYRDF